jgi:hypothetical protein
MLRTLDSTGERRSKALCMADVILGARCSNTCAAESKCTFIVCFLGDLGTTGCELGGELTCRIPGPSLGTCSTCRYSAMNLVCRFFFFKIIPYSSVRKAAPSGRQGVLIVGGCLGVDGEVDDGLGG